MFCTVEILVVSLDWLSGSFFFFGSRITTGMTLGGRKLGGMVITDNWYLFDLSWLLSSSAL